MESAAEIVIFYGALLIAALTYGAKVALDRMDKPKHIKKSSLEWKEHT